MTGAGAEDRLAALFARQRRTLGISLPELALLSGIDRHRLQRLLTPGGAHLRLDEIGLLAEVLKLPQAEVTRTVWPGRPLLDATPATAPDPDRPPAAPEELPTVRLARMLTRSPHWSHTLAPVRSGPTADLQIHLMNRFAVVPAPPQVPLPDHLTLRRRFLEEFTALPVGVAFSVWRGAFSVAERFPHGPQGGHPAHTSPHALYLQSAVYAADRPAGEYPVRLGGAAQAGVVVIGLRALTGSERIAATVARALGWALTDTSRAGSRVAPVTVAEPRTSVRNALRYRNLMLGEFLAAPAAQTVVSHVGTPATGEPGMAPEPHALLLADPDTVPFVVMVRESDALLAASLALPSNARGDRTALTTDMVTTWRDRLVERVDALHRAGRGSVVEMPDGWLAAPDQGRRERLRWRAHVQVSRQVLHDLLHQSGLRTGFAVRDPLARALLGYESPVPWG
ncbi:MAG: hypothetical protein EPN43_03425 [Jatrophihabitans sp.]|nr:MAG: hypothetical protein EPN43_03425 [Jatrophihabitans sp.]